MVLAILRKVLDTRTMPPFFVSPPLYMFFFSGCGRFRLSCLFSKCYCRWHNCGLTETQRLRHCRRQTHASSNWGLRVNPVNYLHLNKTKLSQEQRNSVFSVSSPSLDWAHSLLDQQTNLNAWSYSLHEFYILVGCWTDWDQFTLNVSLWFINKALWLGVPRHTETFSNKVPNQHCRHSV